MQVFSLSSFIAVADARMGVGSVCYGRVAHL